MIRSWIHSAVAAAIIGSLFVQHAAAQLDDHIWVGGTGNQLWQLDANWLLDGMATTFPNDPGRVDSDPAVVADVEGANLSVNLAANLNVDVGATDVTVASLVLGSTTGAVATDITSSGGRLVFENFESNNTAPEPDVCAFNCGAALITSSGVVGATNTITAAVGINDDVHVTGTHDLTLAGGLSEMGTNPRLSVLTAGRTVFITGNTPTVDTSVPEGADDTSLNLNNNTTSQGTIDVVGVISGAGRMRYGNATNGALPIGTIILRSANSYSGRTFMGRGNLILGDDNAMGTGDFKEEGASGVGQTGYNIIATDTRTITKTRIIGQWMTIKGEHSLTWNGMAYQDNTGGWINLLPAGKTLTLSGPQYPNHTEELGAFPISGRFLSFDGTGMTLVSGGLHNEYDDPNNPLMPQGHLGNFTFQGSGTYVVSGGTSTYTGITEIRGANVHFAANADFGGTLEIRSTGGAVGVDAGVIGNSTFLGKLSNSSNPLADAAGNLILYDHGGLMLATSEYGSNLDFTSGDLANAGDMSLAAHEAGSPTGHTYTGDITPRNNTYRFGGGSGTLTLPGRTGSLLPNQLTGARSVVATNGGTVNITNTNNYTGTTSIIAKYMDTLEAVAAADAAPNTLVDGDSVPNDQKYVGTTLTVNSLVNGGSVSSIGSSINAASNLYIQGSTLKYVGGATSTNRLFTIGSGGATIDSSGAGTLSFTNTGSLAVDIAEARTGNANAFATGNTVNDRNTIRNVANTSDLVVGMPIQSPGLGADGIPAGATITRVGATDIGISLPIGEFAFFNDTPITFGAAPERKLTLAGANADNNTLASVIGNASDGGLVGLTKTGGGKWIVTANNTYGGATTVSAGTLLINGSHSGNGLTTVAGGTLGGTGTLAGGLTVASGGHLAPGQSVGTFNVGGAVIFDTGSILDFELGAPGTSDKLNSTLSGGLTINGGTVHLTNAGGLAAGLYTLIDYTGALVGTVDNFVLGSVPGGFGFDLVDTGSLINLTVSAAPTNDADFNNDGVIDAADYIVWRKFNGGPGTQATGDANDDGNVNATDYGIWQDTFGEPAPGGGGVGGSVGGTVPEPGTLSLVLLAIVGTLCKPRRGR